MKKVLVVLISVFGFFLLIYLTVPYLINFGLQKKTNNQNQNNELKEILKKTTELEEMLEKTQVIEFLNKDNLYENYSHNYTIKIPENFKQNNGIGKYSSTQFYNEDLGYVVAINVGKSNWGYSIDRYKNNDIIKKLSDEIINDKSIAKIFEETYTERGFNNPKLVSNKAVNYNNRMFLKLNFKANRITNNEEIPVLISMFMTYYKDFAYIFQFDSYQKESLEKWNMEIQKAMSNVIISKYIIKKQTNPNPKVH